VRDLGGANSGLSGPGGVCGGADLAPCLDVELDEAASRVDLARVGALHVQDMQVATTIDAVGRYGSAYPKGLKYALSSLGLCHDSLAEPFRRFGPAEGQRIARHLHEPGIASGAARAGAKG
jgi:dihydrodipicolinate synthase/N-acetylneuraminate lyase